MLQLAFIQNLPQLVRQPPLIAAIASLGLHGLVAMSFPQFTLSTQEEGEQKPRGTVDVIALSPTEQSRIPQLAQANNAIPPLGTQTLPPLPPIPTDLPPPPSNIPPLINNPPYNYPVSPVPNRPQPRRSRVPQDVLAIPGQGRRINNNEAVSVLPSLGGRRLPPPRTNLPVNPNPINPDRGNNPPQYRVDNRTRISSILPGGVNPGEFDLGGENPPNPTPEPTNQETAFNPEGTSTDAYRSRLAGWAASTGKVPTKGQEVSLNLPLPTEVCDLGVSKATAIFGTVVDGQGNVTGQPELLQPSGYAILNRKALESVRSHNYPASGNPQPYVVQVAFNRQGSSCSAIPARTVQNEPTNRNSASPTSPGNSSPATPDRVRPPGVNPSPTPTNSPATPEPGKSPVATPAPTPTNSPATPARVRPPVIIVPPSGANTSPPSPSPSPTTSPSPRPAGPETASPSPSPTPQGESPSPSPSPSPEDNQPDPDAPRGSAADLL